MCDDCACALVPGVRVCVTLHAPHSHPGGQQGFWVWPLHETRSAGQRLGRADDALYEVESHCECVCARIESWTLTVASSLCECV